MSKPPPTLPGYGPLSEIARGAFGVVYRAVDSLGRDVAIKFVHAVNASDPQYRQQLLNEARALARFEHDNIIKVHTAGEVDGQPYLVMSFAPTSLAAEMERFESEEQVLGLVRDVATGLRFIHTKGLVHRDLKPDNIFLSDEGVAMVGDFGIAKEANTPLTRADQSPGTWEYMSPEQLRGQLLDGRSDLYSLGCLLFQLVEGTVPFAHVVLHLEADPPELTRLKRLQPIVSRLLAKEAADRFQSADELICAIDGLIEPAVRKPIARVAWIVGGLLLLAITAGVWFLKAPAHAALQVQPASAEVYALANGMRVPSAAELPCGSGQRYAVVAPGFVGRIVDGPSCASSSAMALARLAVPDGADYARFVYGEPTYASAQPVLAQIQGARIAAGHGNRQHEIDDLRFLAQHGDVAAAMSMADLLEQKLIDARGQESARSYLVRAAASDFPLAWYQLGRAVSSSPATQASSLRKAAEAGLAPAQYEVGATARDPVEQLRWTRAAALQGFPLAALALAQYHLGRGDTGCAGAYAQRVADFAESLQSGYPRDLVLEPTLAALANSARSATLAGTVPQSCVEIEARGGADEDFVGASKPRF